jgi:hypothetical protein
VRLLRFICRWRGYHKWVERQPFDFIPFDQGGYNCSTCSAYEGVVARARRERAGLPYVG